MDDNPATMKIKTTLTPRGNVIQPTNPDGSPGLSYTTKYSSNGLPVIGSTVQAVAVKGWKIRYCLVTLCGAPGCGCSSE